MSTTHPGEEYIIVWDGRVDSRDSDLLDPSLRWKESFSPTDVTTFCHVRRGEPVRVRLRQLLKQAGPLTVRQIVAMTALKEQTVRNALWHLLFHGELASTRFRHRSVYRLVGITVR